MTPTRSPGATPFARSSPATRAVASSSAAYDSSLSSTWIATRSGSAAALRLSRSAMFGMSLPSDLGLTDRNLRLRSPAVTGREARSRTPVVVSALQHGGRARRDRACACDRNTIARMPAARDAVAADLIATALESRRDELIAVAVEEIKSRMPAYREADPQLLEDVRGHVGEHHDLLCAVLRRGRPAQAREFEFVGRHAAMRARRGIALPDFLEAFRSYHNVVWDAVLDAAHDGREAAGEALAAARTVIRHIDLATTEASAAYLEAQQLLLADGDRVRRDLLEDLLAARAPGTAAGMAAARAAGLEDGARCVLVAALPTAAPEDEGVLRLAANTLATAIRGRTAPLAVTRHGEIVLVRAL